MKKKHFSVKNKKHFSIKKNSFFVLHNIKTNEEKNFSVKKKKKKKKHFSRLNILISLYYTK